MADQDFTEGADRTLLPAIDLVGQGATVTGNQNQALAVRDLEHVSRQKGLVQDHVSTIVLNANPYARFGLQKQTRVLVLSTVEAAAGVSQSRQK